MAASVVLSERLEIPGDLDGLANFRRWAVSDGFPEEGRIDYLSGRIEVDMSPEDFFCHGTLKGEIYSALLLQVKRRRLGYLVTDSTRVSSVEADCSVEPDVVFVSHESLASGRVRLVPEAGAGPGRYVEIEGPPDLIVEVVSDSSVEKDTQRLPAAYFRAGVREFWLADVRGPEPIFRIHGRGASGYQPVGTDAEGFQVSAVLGAAFRLDARRDDQGHWQFDVQQRPA